MSAEPDPDEEAAHDEWVRQAQAPPPKPSDDNTWYPFRDEFGKLRYYKHRTYHLENGEWVKDIRYFHPDKRTPGKPDGAPWLPYKLPELIKGVEQGEEPWLCEGERDTEALIAAGVCATTCGGANDWRPEVADLLARVLKGARVVISPDMDDPGIGLAQRELATLQPVAASVTIKAPRYGFKDAAEHLESLPLEQFRSVLTVYPDSGEVVNLTDVLRLKLEGESSEEDDDLGIECVDWQQLLEGGNDDPDWLVDELWPMGRQAHVHAQRKVGKSLVSLYLAACLAMGRHPFLGSKIPPIRVLYLDYEMTEDDLRERVTDMGFKWQELTNLRYSLGPRIPPLDTAAGGQLLMRYIARHQIKAVIIDTMSRVIEGNENDASTYLNFFRNTGMLLKHAQVSLWRLDHEGHLEGRSRGSSAKADDVDVIWQLKAIENGYQFVRKDSRVTWVPEQVTIQKAENPNLNFIRAAGGWPDGTKEKAKELDAVEAPLDVSSRKAAELLKAGGFAAGKNAVLLAALRFRNQRVIWP